LRGICACPRRLEIRSILLLPLIFRVLVQARKANCLIAHVEEMDFDAVCLIGTTLKSKVARVSGGCRMTWMYRALNAGTWVENFVQGISIIIRSAFAIKNIEGSLLSRRESSFAQVAEGMMLVLVRSPSHPQHMTSMRRGPQTRDAAECGSTLRHQIGYCRGLYQENLHTLDVPATSYQDIIPVSPHR
jgi:hypothetical protein